MTKLNPNATDGDNDGLIQDGTPHERPQRVHPSTGKQTNVQDTTPNTYTPTAADTFASIAAQHPTPGLTKHQRALDLVAKNQTLTPGVPIKL